MPETWAISGVDLHLDLSGSRVRAGLEGALRDAIRAGRLHPGTRLPSSRALAADPVLARYRAWLATPAGRTVAARYRLGRPGLAARAASGTPAPGGGLRLRLRLPLGEIAATGTAAACAFVVVLLAVLWMSPQGFIGRSARAARARRRRGTG